MREMKLTYDGVLAVALVTYTTTLLAIALVVLALES